MKKSKKCSSCKEIKDVIFFRKREANTDGLNGWCMVCERIKKQVWLETNSERVKKYKKNQEKWRNTNKLRAWGNHLRRRYWPNFTTEEAIEKYNQLFQAQGGCCYICKRFPKTKKLSVDHNHKTGDVRKLLCFRCNKLLVSYHDLNSAKLLYDYLLEHEKKV